MNLDSILDKALGGEEVSAQEGAILFTADEEDLQRLIVVADELRRRKVGDQVGYVINRNVNFTNVCVKRCGFCAFSRGHSADEGYFLPVEEILRRIGEASALDATEVCIQAGLPPRIDGSFYIELCRAIKKSFPEIHVHAFSPEEVLYGATLSNRSVEDYLKALLDAGLGSMPGTSAEILDDSIREKISPGRITTSDWLRVLQTAHKLGIPTTSTIMYGHVETGLDRARHLALLRTVQQETGQITEFVPLSFVAAEAPMAKHSLVTGIQKTVTREDVLRMYAVARLMLNGWIPNIQASWVKQGPSLAQDCLHAGANDFGGTLMNESISTSAGALHGQYLHPSRIRNIIRAAQRAPYQRSTSYDVLRRFEIEPEALEPAWGNEQFGSYQELIASSDYRFRDRRQLSLRH
jgi:7,8-didemethyl-8-hydroxy-5-deazariboflavin synthase CofH subunit